MDTLPRSGAGACLRLPPGGSGAFRDIQRAYFVAYIMLMIGCFHFFSLCFLCLLPIILRLLLLCRPPLNKLHIGIKSSLEIITSDSAHVLGDDTADLPGLNIGNQPLPIRALKIAPGPSAVRIMDTTCKAALGRVAFQQHFLRSDLSRIISLPNNDSS